MVEILQKVECHGKGLGEQESLRLNGIFNPSDFVTKVFSQVLWEKYCFVKRPLQLVNDLVYHTLFKSHLYYPVLVK